jgi:hypothetical protein
MSHQQCLQDSFSYLNIAGFSKLRLSTSWEEVSSRTSGENLFDLLFMAPSSQSLEPPQNPGRFKEIYQKHPSLRPSSMELEAQRLREQADLIDDEALDLKMKLMSLKRISQLENCKNNLASRLK